MTEEELVSEVNKLIRDYDSACYYSIVIVNKSNRVIHFGFGCQRCMASVLEKAAQKASEEPHNKDHRVH